MINRFKTFCLSILSQTKQLDHGTIIVLSASIVHVISLVVFSYLSIPIMIVINLLSIMVCFAMFLPEIRNDYSMILKIIFTESIFYIFAATICIGWNAGFPLYIFALIPFTYYISYLSTLKDDNRISTLGFSIVATVAFLSMRLYSYFEEPLYRVSEIRFLYFIYMVNAGISILLILFCLSVFYSAITFSESTLRARNSRLSSLAITDPLTGFYNRRFMVDHLRQAVYRAEQTNIPFSLLLCDIDDFKLINDTYGHNCGDQVILKMSSIMHRIVRDSDYICRWGGEEILILLPGCPANNAARLAEKIRAEIIEHPVQYHGNTVPFSMTFGIQSYEACTDYLELLKKADSKLYQGKQNGKNCIVL